MTVSVQTSVIMSASELRYKNSHRHHCIMNYYQATITDFEGDEYDYEVEAESFEDAAAQLESIAYDNLIQVYNMNIYQVG